MNRIKQLNEQRGAKLKEAATLSTDKAEDRSKIQALHSEIEGIDSAIIIEARQLELAGQRAPVLSEQEKRDSNRFDLGRLLGHLHRAANGAHTTLDGVEAEMVQEGEKERRTAGIQSGGVSLPRFLVRNVERRDLTATGGSSGSEGGNTIATAKVGLLDDFFNAAGVVTAAGSTRLEGLVGNVDLPRLVAGTAPSGKAENAAADEVSPTTAMLQLSPKRLPAFIDLSDRLLMQSSVAITSIIQKHLVAQMGAKREAAFFHGTGTNEANGIAGTSGIVAGGTNGLAPTLAHMIALETAVDTSNALLGNLKYISNGEIRGKLKGTVRFASTDSVTVLQDGRINGYDALFTNAISRTLTKGSSSLASAIFFGNFSDYVEAYWGGINLEMVRDTTGAKTGLTTLVASIYYDGGVVRPKSFAAMLDALGA